MALWALYVEELRGHGRGRFGSFALALLLLFVAALAIGPGVVPDARFLYAFFVYVVIPGGFAAFAAARWSAPRASRFVQAVFTTPVSRASYFAAHLLVVLTVGVGYLALTAPLLAVYAVHVGVPGDLLRFLAAGAGMILWGAAMGTMVGVLFPGRSAAPAVTLGVLAALLVLAVPFVIAAAMGSMPESVRPLTLRLGQISPHVLALGAAGGLGPVAPEQPARAAVALFGAAAGFVLLAALAYLALQGVEEWNAGAAGRWAVGLVAAALVAAPALVSDPSYEPAANGTGGGECCMSMEHALMGVFVVEPGGDAPLRRLWAGDPNRPLTHVPVGTSKPVDLLFVFPAHESERLRALEIHVRPLPGLALDGAERILDPAPEAQRAAGPGEPSHVLVYRVGAVATVDRAPGLSGVRLQARVWTNMSVDLASPSDASPSDPAVRHGRGSFPVAVDVPGARSQVAAATLAVPALLVAVGLVRAARRR